MATSSTPKRRYPTSFNGGESQDPDDVRVGETHHLSPDAAPQPGADTAADDAAAAAASATEADDDDAGVPDDADEGRVGSVAPASSSSGVRRDRPRPGGDAADTRDPEDTRDARERPR
ncbi:MAG: hypothetical protein ACJ8G7_17195 [Rhizobacter sp.]